MKAKVGTVSFLLLIQHFTLHTVHSVSSVHGAHALLQTQRWAVGKNGTDFELNLTRFCKKSPADESEI